jgi:hypothetical protein
MDRSLTESHLDEERFTSSEEIRRLNHLAALD